MSAVRPARSEAEARDGRRMGQRSGWTLGDGPDPIRPEVGTVSRVALQRALRTVPLLALAERGMIAEAEARITHDWCRLVEAAVRAGDGPRLASPSWTRAGGGHGSRPAQIGETDVRQRVAAVRARCSPMQTLALAVVEAYDGGMPASRCRAMFRLSRVAGMDAARTVAVQVRLAALALQGGE